MLVSTCTMTHTLVFVFMTLLDLYRDGCRNVWGKLSSNVEALGLRLVPARHELINIAAAEASLNTRLLFAVIDGCR